MALSVTKTALGSLSVGEAMRKQVMSLPGNAPIASAVRLFIKYKVNALLITESDAGAPAGVVSKTDIMGAYYASIPVDSPLEMIMVGPPLFCSPDDSLESALDVMKTHGVYRLYVFEAAGPDVLGVLAYPDIVGVLYQFCRKCDRSLGGKRRLEKAGGEQVLRLKVKDAMTPKVVSFSETDSLLAIMEGLSAYRFGAVLIEDEDGVPAGVISKTDLILAYLRGASSEVEAGRVLGSRQVIVCNQDDFIEHAIKTMVFSEIHRLFVHDGDSRNLTGVFSLSDAARLRSGSCQACVTARLRPDQGA
jgi:CBS domain-containing protein